MGMGQEIMDALEIKEGLLEERRADLVDSKCWETADKRVLKIEDMDDSHLRNTINWLRRNDYYCFADSFISLMEEELGSREVKQNVMRNFCTRSPHMDQDDTYHDYEGLG